MRNRNVTPGIFLAAILIGSVFLSTLPSTIAQGNIRDKELTFILSRPSNVWSDSQWKFFNITVVPGGTFNVSASYSGDLDIDLRLYSGDAPDNIKPWDITREGMKDVPHRANSQFRGTQKEEILAYTNEFSLINETMYLLVYVFSGTGNSTVVMNSNIQLEEVQPPIGGFEGFFTSNFIYIIGAIAVIFVVVTVLTVKKVKKVKRKMAEEKLAVDEKPKAA